MGDKFDAESALACACDLMNTWCRESQVPECQCPFAHETALRNTIDALWSTLSARDAILQSELSALRSQVADALAADGQWMEQTGELRKQVARLRSLLARYREHIVAEESTDYLGHHKGMPPNTFLTPPLALSADEAEEIRAIAAEEIPALLPSIKD